MQRNHYLFGITFIVIAFFCSSCSRPKSKTYTEKLSGIWQNSYTGTNGINKRYFKFSPQPNNEFIVTMDEPGEDWYDIPVKFALADSSFSLELWWGNEILNGSFVGDESITGMRNVQGVIEPFTFTKCPVDTSLSYLIPGTGQNHNNRNGYKYIEPVQLNDGLLTSSLKNSGMDSTLVYHLMNRILGKSLPKIHSVLVVKDGKLIIEDYFYGYTQSSEHRIHSVTKGFTSALTGIVIDKGLIQSADIKAADFFREHKSLEWISKPYPVTVQHLLSMTSGVLWQPITLNGEPDIIKMYNSSDCLEYILAKKLKVPPGTLFHYNDANSILLGKILEKAANTTVNEFARTNLFEPLGISGYDWDVVKDGTTRTDGGLRLKSRDLAKFGMLYLDNGRWNGQQIISEKWVKESFARHTPLGQTAYGYNWWLQKFVINHHILEAYCAIGHGEQFVFIIPELNLVTVFTAGNYFQTERLPLEIMADYIFPAIMKNETFTALEMNPASMEKITGEYAINAAENLTVKYDNDQLYIIDPGQNKLDLFPVSDKQYFTKNPPREALFIETPNEHISHAEIYINGIKSEEFVKL